MIKNFSDHSANERTFLAWVRTSIAVMAFGFIVEKFDLFLEVAAPSLAGRMVSIPGQRFGDIAGLALIIIGTAMVAIAAIHETPAMRLASIAGSGERASPKSTSATAVPTAAPPTSRSAPIFAFHAGMTNVPPTAPRPIAPSRMP